MAGSRSFQFESPIPSITQSLSARTDALQEPNNDSQASFLRQTHSTSLYCLIYCHSFTLAPSTMALRYLALKPFLAAMSKVVGPEISAQMRISVIGDVQMEAYGLHPAKVSSNLSHSPSGAPALLTSKPKDAELLIPNDPHWNRFKIIKEVSKFNPCFSVNMEAKCGVTFLDKGEVQTLDLIDNKVVSPNLPWFSLSSSSRTLIMPLT